VRGETGRIPTSTSLDRLPSFTCQIKPKNMKFEDSVNTLKPLINLSTISREMSKDVV